MPTPSPRWLSGRRGTQGKLAWTVLWELPYPATRRQPQQLVISARHNDQHRSWCPVTGGLLVCLGKHSKAGNEVWYIIQSPTLVTTTCRSLFLSRVFSTDDVHYTDPLPIKHGNSYVPFSSSSSGYEGSRKPVDLSSRLRAKTFLQESQNYQHGSNLL